MHAGRASSRLLAKRLIPRCAAPIFMLLLFSAFASGIQAEPSSGRVLTTLSQVRNFPRDSSIGSVPVHVSAVVTYYDSVGPNLFVQDGTAGAWVDLRGVKTDPPRVGTMLDLVGTVGSGFSPYVAEPRWRVVGTAPLPKPERLDFEQAATGSYDSQWVEMEGVVRSFVQEAEGSVLVIDAATPTGAFKVRIPDYHAGFPMQLVDAKVRFRGVCGSAFNQRKQLVSIHVMSPGLQFMTVLDPPPKDPFAVPTTAIDKIGLFSTGSADLRRVKVRGVTTAQFPGRGLFLMDHTGGIYAETQDGTKLTPGDEVELIGFPARGDYSAVLRSAGIRPTGRHQVMTPSRVDGRAALSGRFDAQLTSISGTLQAVNGIPGSYTLILQSLDRVGFQARFIGPVSLDALPSIGSTVLLTGICSTKTDENGNPAAFEIVLRAPSDLRVLSSPPWLSGLRAVFLLSGGALLTLIICAWVFVLRRRVRQQTRLIQARLENEMILEDRYRRIFERNLTGLFVASRDGRILDCNEICAHILGYSSRRALLDHADEAGRIAATIHENLQQEPEGGPAQLVNAECRFLRRDGVWRWVLANVRLVAQKGEEVLEAGVVDITDRKEAEERIQYLAYYDSLTGLPNRTLLKDRVASAIAAAGRHSEKAAILFLDLDRFKMVNDSLGHSYGDLILKEVARRLSGLVRDGDTVSRAGGDEFLILLTSIERAEEAALAAERLIRSMAAEFAVGERGFKIGCSIGISVYPEHGTDAETLIKNADAAMYCAKESGGLAYRFFADSMNTQVVERFRLENALRLALTRDELFLVYQPQMSLTTGEVTGVEALLRWRHPELGLVPPGRFIPIAESSGLILPIGEWVLRTSCAQIRKWLDEGLPVPSIAVNVSAVQVRQEHFRELVRTTLRDTGLPPQFLELEITESLLLSRGEGIRSMLQELKSLGVSLAIDDFGTGYSSLSYLRQFPVSRLKIDGSFIKEVTENPDDAAITTAIIHLGKALNLRVLGECVETEAQMDFLRSRQCDEFQGFYGSRPLTADMLEETLKRLRRGVAFAAALAEQTA